MRWIVRDGENEFEVTWTERQVTGPSPVIERVAELVAARALVAPVPGTDRPAGLVEPFDAWATVTHVLAELYGDGVEAPPPPGGAFRTQADVIY